MGEKVLTNMKHKNKFIKKNNSIYTPAKWCAYYRDSLKIMIKQYYPIKDILIDYVCVKLLPKNTKTYMFWLEYSNNNIYLYISWKVINVSNYIKDIIFNKTLDF